MTAPAALVATTSGPEDTRALAGAIAELCEPGDVLLLAGDLGSGKTTFAQGFGAGLGVTEPITSPTFALVRQYRLGDGGGDDAGGGPRLRTLLHADVYRLDHLAEIADLGLGELVEDGAVALVEWGDRAEPVLGDGSLSLRLEAGPGDPDDRRTVTILWSGPRWADRWQRLARVVTGWATGR
ncbi:MAG TPA: tRNA (adenosine(37)-N6)-threonylcarbamoyltransferase complex ATPase subunit type 1 TsaE [Acidimicrobiales bacterium]|nr:tRNA (adenosine(37)-N6)-threonylcarbamoyltransferase complex ATPase subunit type 1 TsaE [Acidimicrobiales bacterium]